MEINDYIELKLTHSLHTSERLSFRGCRRRHHWLFVDRWYPTTTAKPLEFGAAFHVAMQTWYDPLTWNKDPETRLTLALLAFKNMCNEQKAKYLQGNEGNIDPEVEQDFKERVELGEGMIRYHCTKVSPKLDIGFRPIRVEIEFEVPVLGDLSDPESVIWCKCDHCWKLWIESETGKAAFADWYKDVDREQAWPVEKGQDYWRQVYWKGLPVTLGGRIDMLAQDENGRYWIFDWKTAARLSGQEEQDSPDEFILLDDQITSYCFALWLLGIDVAGFVHHEMKKAFPEEPEPNKVQRKGCWYSVNKMQNTSYELYVETVSEGDPYGYSSGAYNDFLDWLKRDGPRFHSRKQVTRSEEELLSAGKNIYLEALDITDPGLRIYPSPGRYACTFCAFRQPCIATNRNEDVQYLFLSNFEKRTRRYWEESKPSTESKGGQ